MDPAMNLVDYFEVQFREKVLRGNPTLFQLSKFGFVGVLNTIIGYGSFVLLLNYTNYLAALVISHLIGVSHSFIWNKYWIFKSSGIGIGGCAYEFAKFNSVYAGVFLTNAAVLIISVNIFNVDPRISQLIALPIITIISFAGHKYWSFKKGKQGNELAEVK
ncbi:MAG: GtrA family protein [Methanothrix sp.]|nr:MAG: GtrA family protein [Methanothrix sp.]